VLSFSDVVSAARIITFKIKSHENTTVNGEQDRDLRGEDKESHEET
jgi:hypothetical protein